MRDSARSGKSQSQAAPARAAPGPEVLVVGAATRDLAADDPRGWRLGGGVCYAALTVARLGLRTAALVGADRDAADAAELGVLRDAGVDVRIVPLARGPVFENIEGPTGRLQRAAGPADAVPVEALPAEWANAPGWILASVAGEVGKAWARAIPAGAVMALGWQGLLRSLEADGTVRKLPPTRTALLERADLVGVSDDDLGGEAPIDGLSALLRPPATLVITLGRRGGLVVELPANGDRRLRRYPPVAQAAQVDATGAGDAFLATLLAARIRPGLVGWRADPRVELLLAATVASLTGEEIGLAGVPDRSSIRQRMREARLGR